ncbi:MAG: hypothetical protein WKF75_12015 [Singulisphaera sp.]
MYPTLARLVRTTDRDGRPAAPAGARGVLPTVRALELGDRVLPVVGDFAGPIGLARARRLAPPSGARGGVALPLRRGVLPAPRGRFRTCVENLARLPWAADALLIRTSTREIDHPERAPGDSSTTIVRPVAPFLEAAGAGRVRRVEDLFDDGAGA